MVALKIEGKARTLGVEPHTRLLCAQRDTIDLSALRVRRRDVKL